MDEASRMLGRRFCLRLKVEHGNCIGRLLDFPTINQSFPQHHIVPRYGVYSTVVNVAGKLYGGVTNVGVKPTVGSDRSICRRKRQDSFLPFSLLARRMVEK